MPPVASGRFTPGTEQQHKKSTTCTHTVTVFRSLSQSSLQLSPTATAIECLCLSSRLCGDTNSGPLTECPAATSQSESE